MDRQDIANSLAGTKRLENDDARVKAGDTQTLSGRLVEDTDDGIAKVYISDDVTQPDDYDGDGTTIEIPTSVSGKAGDEVLITSTGKKLSVPMVTANQGFGDRIKKLADEAMELAEAINQYFWNDTNGVHVSTQPGIAEGTRNILLNSYGLLLRAVGNWLAALTESGVTFYDGQGNTSDNILAAFTNSGTQIGKKTETHVVIDNDSFDILDGLNRLLTQMNEAGWYRIIPIQQYQNDDPTQSENPYYDETRPYVYGLVLDTDVDDVLGLKHQLIFGDDYVFSYYDENLQDWASWPGVNARLESRAKGLAQIYMSAESKDNPGYYAAISASAGGSSPSLEGITLTSSTPGSSTGGLINIEGRLVLKYQMPLYGEDINLNTLIPLIHINTNGNIIVGNNNNSGNTRIYGNNVDVVSDGKFRMNTSPPVVVEYKDITVSSTSAQTNFLTTVSVAKSGYTPTAIAGKYFTSGTRQNFLNDWGTHLEGNTLYVRLCNVHASQAANGTYRVQIEYHRNEML